ncbi:MAG: hypothetical protein ACKOC5_08655 [Chloroflexota bacterium]
MSLAARLARLEAAASQREALDLVDITDEFTAAMRKVFGEDHQHRGERLIVPRYVLVQLALIYGGDDDDPEDTSPPAA